jgi:hypothetical protein
MAGENGRFFAGFCLRTRENCLNFGEKIFFQAPFCWNNAQKWQKYTKTPKTLNILKQNGTVCGSACNGYITM